MTSTDFLWIMPSLATLAVGWLACDWRYRGRIKVLQAQIQAERVTAQERAAQARQQMGQLQAELAARPPLPPSVREQRDLVAAEAAAAQDRRAALDKQLDGDGFAATHGSGHGFAITQVMS